MRVLVADDSQVSRKLLGRLLAGWGYDVVPCENGAEAWELLSGPDAPKLAILDWVMPGLDGIEVCRLLREHPSGRHVFVYLVSARSSPEDMLRGLEAGANDYLIKPFNHAELRVRLQNGRRLVELHDELVCAREALRTQAMVDPLTQIWNRRAFLDLAAKEVSRAARASRATSALMIDIDHFKSINDRYGHAAGDRTLTEVAARIKSALRGGDHLARYGGEEFVVLLPDCDARGAYAVAERVRRAIAKSAIETDGHRIPVTASLGAASCPTSVDSLEALLARADAALYAAKRAGRDRSILAAPTPLAETG
ncbi:MAG: diguanylate cyclase [Sandaracinaceae bacterium]